MALALVKTNSLKLHRLKALLPKLDETQRIVIHLRFWENLSIQEISKFLGISWEEADHLLEKTISILRSQFDLIEVDSLTPTQSTAA